MRIAVLLSGGVDSSVALRLLADEGHTLHAFYLKIWLEDELAHLGSCPWEEDLSYARAVCDQLGVPLSVVALQHTYHQRVVSQAVAALAAGDTPSPDVLCNREIKYGAFLDHVDAQTEDGPFDLVASGHYARREQRDDVQLLLRGVDPVKDQTYFLHRLDQRQLARCVFPLGALFKEEVRHLAAGFGLPTQERADSQGICFLGKIPYDDFVRGYLGERPGEIRQVGSERLLGTHRGLWFHTIGQRKGLGLGAGPWFVVHKDPEQNVLYVAHGDALAAFHRHRFLVPAPHWITAPPPAGPLAVKVRHGPHTHPCRIAPRPEGGVEITLEVGGDPGIAPGQSAVLYNGDRCLGGGVIGW